MSKFFKLTDEYGNKYDSLTIRVKPTLNELSREITKKDIFWAHPFQYRKWVNILQAQQDEPYCDLEYYDNGEIKSCRYYIYTLNGEKYDVNWG